MAAGDRKLKISVLNIQNGNPVNFNVQWGLSVEDNAAIDHPSSGGSTAGTFGTMTTFNALTGLQIKQIAVNAINTDPNVPPHDTVS